MIEFGKTLRLAREAKGLTVAQIADVTHMAPKTVLDLEAETLTIGSISSRLCILSSGMRTVRTPAEYAAIVFSFKPPMGSTLPRRDTSPVIAISRRTGAPVKAEIIAVQTVMPAEGPSLGLTAQGKRI